MEWKNWQHVRFSDRESLPICSGIYVITDMNENVWYVGKATDLRKRWIGKGHHRYPQLIRSNRRNEYRIHWLCVPSELLNAQELSYINLFKPELNGCKVKSYIPKQPLVEREIKRVLGVLNKKTALFPSIRSVAIGGYIASNRTRCVLIGINTNDFSVLNNSSQKKYAPSVRQAWGELVSFCGREEGRYHCPQIPIYQSNEFTFEFVHLPELVNYFEANPEVLMQYVHSISLYSLEIETLCSLKILRSISFEEEYQHKHSPDKIQLYPGAYLKYRLSELKNLTDFLELEEDLKILENHITKI
jgi:GIY-YIG catalytic domain